MAPDNPPGDVYGDEESDPGAVLSAAAFRAAAASIDALAHAGARDAPDCTAESHRRSRADPGERPGTNGDTAVRGGRFAAGVAFAFAGAAATAAAAAAAATTTAGGVEGSGVASSRGAPPLVLTTMVSGGEPTVACTAVSVGGEATVGSSFAATFDAARAGVSGRGVIVNAPEGPAASNPRVSPRASALMVASASASFPRRVSISARPFASAASASFLAPSSVEHRARSSSSSFSSLLLASESSTTCRMSLATLRFSSGPRSWNDACVFSPRGT